MAAIFQIRRGTINATLTEGELYLHQGSGSLQFGSGSNIYNTLTLNAPVKGDINLIGNISASGDVRIGGNIYLGDSAATDNISALGVFTTNLVPNGTIDLGTTSAKWNNVYANNISGAISATNGVISGSSQVISILTSLNTFSGSQLTQNTALATISGSLISTASANVISITALNSFSSSQLTQNIALATISGSLIISASADRISITNLNLFSGSQLTQNTALATISGSLISTASANGISITELNSYTSSLKNAITVTGVDTNSLTTIRGDFRVLGTSSIITSQHIHLDDNIIELNGTGGAFGGFLVRDLTGGSTVSGSLKWNTDLDRWEAGKDAGDNTEISKILLAGGDNIISASSQLTELNSFTGSQLTQNTSLATITGSLITSASNDRVSITNLNTETSSLETRMSALATISGSLIGSASADRVSITNINTTTGSLNTSISNINTLTSSILTQLTSLATISGSLIGSASADGVSITNLNLFTASVTSSLTSIYQTTGSLNTFSASINNFTASMSSSFLSLSASVAYINGGVDFNAIFLGIQQVTSSLHSYTSSANIRFTNIEAATSSYETKGRGIVSGSSQIVPLLPTGVVSGSSQVLGGSGVWSGSAQLPSGVVSGSSQVLGGSGVVSGSYETTGRGIWSGSAQLPVGVISGSSQVLGGSGLWSGSAQLPAGVVSGSSQILGGSGITSGSYETTGRSIVSSSAQIVPLLPSGVVSGSTQVITNNSITLGTHTVGSYIQTIAGTTNQITVAGSGLESADVTLSLPQNIHTSATPTFAGLTINGAITATGDITAYYSDKRLKDISGNIDSALDKVNQISGVYYKQNELAETFGYTNYNQQVGVIAQEIQSVLPEAIALAPFDRDENGNSKSGENYLTVHYEKIIPLLIQSIKELSAKVKELENK